MYLKNIHFLLFLLCFPNIISAAQEKQECTPQSGVNAFHDFGGIQMTELMYAVEARNAENIEYLLNMPGIDVLVRIPASGLTALHFLIGDQTNRRSIFRQLSVDELRRIIRLLKNKGMDINAQNNTGLAPLHYAIFYLFNKSLDLNLIHAFILEGADVNTELAHGETLLYSAIRDLLLKEDCLGNIKPCELPFIHLKIINMLLEAGADITMRGSNDIFFDLIARCKKYIWIHKASWASSRTRILQLAYLGLVESKLNERLRVLRTRPPLVYQAFDALASAPANSTNMPRDLVNIIVAYVDGPKCAMQHFKTV